MSFIYSDFGPAGVSPEDNYQVLTIFDPVIPAPNSGSYAYTLSIDSTLGAGYTFKDVELDVIHSGSGQEVTKNATGVPDLISLNGDPVLPVAFAPGLTTIQVTDSWTADPNLGNIGGINNTFTQAKAPQPPAPCPCSVPAAPLASAAGSTSGSGSTPWPETAGHCRGNAPCLLLPRHPAGAFFRFEPSTGTIAPAGNRDLQPIAAAGRPADALVFTQPAGLLGRPGVQI
ncbi:MAG: hypothetical protein ACKOZT_05980 [Cyanobium sp.]